MSFKLTFTILDLGNSGFSSLIDVTCLHLDQVETGLKCEKSQLLAETDF
jgi:hypothetical protein